jgi:anthranilate synthase component 2
LSAFLFLPLQKKVVSLLIIDNYDSFTYNLVQYVEQAGKEYFLAKNDRLDTLPPESFEKVLISPGPGIAQEAGQLPDFISAYFHRKSFLGICLGFEALLEFLEAKLSLLPKPMHGIQNTGVVVKEDPLFKNIPKELKIGHYHSWYVKEEDFPGETDILMKDENGLIMAFRHKSLPVYGVQFHPESYMTERGSEIIKNWLEI